MLYEIKATHVFTVDVQFVTMFPVKFIPTIVFFVTVNAVRESSRVPCFYTASSLHMAYNTRIGGVISKKLVVLLRVYRAIIVIIRNNIT